MTEVKEKSFVTFYSPGTLFSEITTKPIDSWNREKAVQMAKGIEERHGATPYGFRFENRLVAEDIPDGRGGTMRVEPKTTAESGMHFLGGKLRTYDEVKADNKDGESILRTNMLCNGWAIVLTNTNSYLSTLPFEANDCIVDRETGEIVGTGSEDELIEYRKQFAIQRKRELDDKG